ncbi:hypothetical protein OUZ56_030433 [Daphnia magna]|uniref:Uncharacterized protein n=1 Tax=Daphnia magna TaxID=35525 RepID=A0ABQ9ZRA0_9CRUS|nr:hypothetical protein OUZ56_030433 [Daphnia magna]
MIIFPSNCHLRVRRKLVRCSIAISIKKAESTEGPRGKIPQVGIQPWQLSIRSWSILAELETKKLYCTASRVEWLRMNICNKQECMPFRVTSSLKSLTAKYKWGVHKLPLINPGDSLPPPYIIFITRWLPWDSSQLLAYFCSFFSIPPSAPGCVASKFTLQQLDPPLHAASRKKGKADSRFPVPSPTSTSLTQFTSKERNIDGNVEFAVNVNDAVTFPFGTACPIAFALCWLILAFKTWTMRFFVGLSKTTSLQSFTMCCIVKGCTRSRLTNNDARFYSIPKVRNAETELLVERRALLLKRVNIKEKQLLVSGKVCDKHLILGKPSYERDISNPDWAPTLLLENNEQLSANRCQRRYIHSQARALLDISARFARKGTICFEEPEQQIEIDSRHDD